MNASPGAVRRFIIEHFSDDDLTQFCFDHFHEVYQNFSDGMTTGRKALLLVDYSNRRDNLPLLMDHLRQERPGPYLRVFGGLPAPSNQRINVNTATHDQLQDLPGIGPALAAAIMSGRPFRSIDELTRVPGIGPKRLAAIRERVDI